MDHKDIFAIGNNWLENTADRMTGLGLDISGCQRDGIYFSVSNMINLYGTKRRKYENLFVFEHPLRVFTMMLEHYASPLSEKEEKFRKCFEKDYLTLMHTSLNHDVYEDGKMDLEELISFYKSVSVKNPKKAAKYCKVLARPKNPTNKQIVRYLEAVGKNPITRYVKVFDIMNNSASLNMAKDSSNRQQFERMIDYYTLFIEEHMPSLKSQFQKNIYNDLTQTKIDFLYRRFTDADLGKIL